MRKYKADYTIGGKSYSLETVAEKVKFTPTVDAHSIAEFTVYNADSCSYDIVAAFEYLTLLSIESEEV